MTQKSGLKLKPLYWFYALSFLLLAFIPVVALLFNDGSMDFGAAAQKASAETGVIWNSNILNLIRLCLAEPMVWMLVFGSAVPSIAGLIVMFFVYDRQAWLRLMNRFRPGINVSVSSTLKNYTLIFALLVPALYLSFFIRTFTGGEPVQNLSVVGWSLIPAILSIALFDQGAILEELGWRGFASDALQEQGLGVLKVAVIVGIAWGLWHLPRDVTTGVIERLGFSTYLFLYLPSFLAGTISSSIVIGYFMLRMGGSILPAILIHGIINDAVGIRGQATIVDALTPYHQITAAIPTMLVALLLMYLHRKKAQAN
tara:strand:- start:31301 stop:32239 length:939 start_codon:yes stop_codon:yes gene_type:complete